MGERVGGRVWVGERVGGRVWVGECGWENVGGRVWVKCKLGVCYVDCTAQAPCTLVSSRGNAAVGDDPQVKASPQPNLLHESNNLQDKDVLT